MFWGRGDTSKLDAATKKTLDQLRRLDETGHLTTLNADKAAAAVRGVEFYSQWESVLLMITRFKNVALLVGAILAIYWATEGALVDWVKAIVKGGS